MAKPAIIFIGRVLILYVVILEYLYPSFISESVVNKGTCYLLAHFSVFVLSIFSVDAFLIKTLIHLDNVPTLYVGTPCSGLEFIILFGILVFAFPTNTKNKYLIFVLGGLSIFLLNISRICGLAIIHRYHLPVFEVNHHVIFNVLAYGIMSIFWLGWARKNTASNLPVPSLKN